MTLWMNEVGTCGNTELKRPIQPHEDWSWFIQSGCGEIKNALKLESESLNLTPAFCYWLVLTRARLFIQASIFDLLNEENILHMVVIKLEWRKYSWLLKVFSQETLRKSVVGGWSGGAHLCGTEGTAQNKSTFFEMVSSWKFMQIFYFIP